jgi:hypothetical protein
MGSDPYSGKRDRLADCDDPLLYLSLLPYP